MIRRVLSAIAAIARSSSIAMLGANFSASMLGFATGIITARALGPEGRGDLAVITFWPAIMALLVDLGLAESITLRVAEERRASWGVVKAGLLIALAGTLVAAVAGRFLLELALRVDQRPLLALATRYLYLFVPASLFSAVFVGALMGLQRFRAVAAVRLVAACFFLVAVTLLAWSRTASPAGLAWLTVASTAIPIPLGAWLFWSSAEGRLADRPMLARQAAAGVRLQGTRLAGALSALQDRATANWTLSPAEIGLYQIPASLTYVMPVIALSFSQVLFSRLGRVEERDRQAEILRAFARAVVMTGGVALLLLPLLPVIVPLVYGRSFAAAAAPAAIVVVAAVLNAGSQMLQSSARSALKVGVCIQAEVGAIAAMALLAWPLAHAFGPSGLAASYAVGRSASLAWMVVRAPSVLGVERWTLFPGSKAFRAAVLADWKTLVRLFLRREDERLAA